MKLTLAALSALLQLWIETLDAIMRSRGVCRDSDAPTICFCCCCVEKMDAIQLKEDRSFGYEEQRKEEATRMPGEARDQLGGIFRPVVWV